MRRRYTSLSGSPLALFLLRFEAFGFKFISSLITDVTRMQSGMYQMYLPIWEIRRTQAVCDHFCGVLHQLKRVLGISGVPEEG